MYEWLSQAVEKDAWVITANNRLAKTLGEHFNAAQLANGKEVWATPRIRSLDSWLQELLREAAQQEHLPLRISAPAAAIVWENCLRQQSLDQLLSVSALLRESRQAWRRVCDWQVPLRELAAAARNSDEQLFAKSVALYAQKLEKNNWVDDAGLCAVVCDLIAERRIQLPKRVTFAGFDRSVPVHAAFWRSLETAGVLVEQVPAASHEGSVEVVTANDSAAELRSAGKWARDKLTDNPTQKLAIVVPGLEQNALPFTRYIREGLVPGWQTDDSGSELLLNVSYGQRLAEYPAIHVGLLVLRWVTSALPFKDVSLLLRSPFVANVDPDIRSRVELKLRQWPDKPWSRASIYRVTEGWLEGAADDWRSRIGAMDRFAAAEGEKRSPSEWAEHFAACLESIGWPGRHSLSSPEFQLINRWRELLNEFARLQPVLPALVLSKAMELLQTLANDAVYQPQAKIDGVQLLGNLESAGMEFDAVWVAGMEATRWPSVANPSNLIARSIQLKYGMPDASPKDSLVYGRAIFSRLRQCADEVIFSWPQSEDETELMPSPFLTEFSDNGMTEAKDPGWYAASLFYSYKREIMLSDPVPPVAAGERIGGGAYTIQRQRTEPFSAFAQGRLLAGEVRVVEPGISPSLRGNVVHKALQNLYRELPSRAELLEWSDDNLSERIQRAANFGLAGYVEEADPVLRRLLYIEKDRLFQVLRAFITEEKQRPDFIVAGVEMDYVLNLSGLELRLRVDRLDALPDSTVIIMDYKTGAPKVLLDKNRNLSDVQLAVYSFAVPGEIGGLVLTNIDVRKVDYRGAGGNSEWAVIAGEDWLDRLCEWKREVSNLAEAIVAGDVRINTSLANDKSRPLALLSRVAELKRVS
jgi:probable DNA repair protein